MKLSAFRHAQRGYALIAALIVLILLMTLTTTITLTLMTEARLAANEERRMQTLYAARAGLEVAAARLMADEPSVDGLGDLWTTMGDEPGEVVAGGGTFNVVRQDEVGGGEKGGMVDEERKLNVNVASAAQLETFLRLAIPDPDRAEFIRKITAAIVERRKAHSFAAVAELTTVDGIDYEFLNLTRDKAPAGLRSLLTVYGDGKVNVNTAPVVVLAAVNGLDHNLAETIVAYRETGGPNGGRRLIKDLADVKERLQWSDAAFEQIADQLCVASRHFTMTSVGRPASEVEAVAELRTSERRIVRQVVRRDGNTLTVVTYEQLH